MSINHQKSDIIDTVSEWLSKRMNIPNEETTKEVYNGFIENTAGEFIAFKTAYTESRRRQSFIITDFLTDKEGYEASSGCNPKSFTSEGRIEEYDLTNYKWIEASKNGIHYFLSLQPYDMYSGDVYHHALFDRIGIHVSGKKLGCRKVDYEIACKKMIITDIDLPVDGNKLSSLAEVMEVLGEYFTENNGISSESLKTLFPDRQFVIARDVKPRK